MEIVFIWTHQRVVHRIPLEKHLLPPLPPTKEKLTNAQVWGKVHITEKFVCGACFRITIEKQARFLEKRKTGKITAEAGHSESLIIRMHQVGLLYSRTLHRYILPAKEECSPLLLNPEHSWTPDRRNSKTQRLNDFTAKLGYHASGSTMNSGYTGHSQESRARSLSPKFADSLLLYQTRSGTVYMRKQFLKNNF